MLKNLKLSLLSCEKQISILTTFLLLVFFLIFGEVKPLFSEVDHQLYTLIDSVNEKFKSAGITEGYVQLDEKDKIILRGKYKTYDEFLYALMIAQLMVPFEKFNPSYDSTGVVIKKSLAEVCFTYAMRGERCPYGRIQFLNFPRDDEHKRSDVKKEDKIKSRAPKKYALVLGVGEFKDKNIVPLYGTVSDAIRFSNMLRERGYEVILLLNEEASVNGVLNALQKIKKQIKRGDTLVVFASSHGAPMDEKGEIGIVLYDSETQTRNCMVEKRLALKEDPVLQTAFKMCTLVKNSLSLKDHIINTFADLESKEGGINLVFVIEACYSGDVFRGVLNLDNPVRISTTEMYEKKLKYFPNLKIMSTSASGNRLAYEMEVSELIPYLKRYLKVNPRFINLKISSDKRRPLDYKIREKYLVYNSTGGIYTTFLVEALPKNGYSLEKSFREIFDHVNSLSKESCVKIASMSKNRRIGIYKKEGDKPQLIKYKDCPDDGQQPKLYRIKVNDFIF